MVLPAPTSAPAEGADEPSGPTGGAGAPSRRRRVTDRLWRPALAALAGLTLWLAFPPYDLWPLAVLAPGALALLCRGRSVRSGALLGLVFGLAFFVPLLSWTGVYVGPAPWLILAAAEAVLFAPIGAATAAAGRLPGWPVWVAAFWVADDAVRDRAPFGGFPWGRLAFGVVDSPLAALASLGGAPLVTFGCALAGTSLAAAARALRGNGPRAAVRPAIGFVVVTLVAGSAAVGLPAGGGTDRTVVVALVQGNVPRLGLDFADQREAVLRNHVDGTLRLAEDVRSGRAPRPDVVIWPENASDVDPWADPNAAALISEAVRAIGVPVLVGAIRYGDRTRENVGVVWDPRTGPGAEYVKRHPVPFGEYIPLRDIARKVSKDVDLVRTDMVGGDTPGVLDIGPITIGDVICFEVAYDGIVRDAVKGGGDVLVVQTNNATFGRTAETWQQLAMGRLRAIEHGRTVLVSATSGVSAVIAPDGHVQQRSDVFTTDLLVREVPVRAGTTLATRVGAVPEYLLVLVAVAALAVAGVGARRRRREETEDMRGEQ